MSGQTIEFRTVTRLGTVIAVLGAFLLSSLASAPLALASGTYSGIAFRDFNGNGVQDSLEPAIAGVTVTMYNAANSSCSTTTDSSGAWSIDTDTCVGGGLSGAGGGYRVEFSIPGSLSFLQNGVVGSGATASQSSVRFVADGGASNVNIAYQNPAQYSQNNPDVAVPFYQAGAATNKTSATDDLQFAYASFPWTATGNATDENQPDATKDVSAFDVGTVWGAGFHRATGRVYASAVLKRHSDLGRYVRPTLDGGETAVNVDGVYIINYGYDLGGAFVGGFLLNGVTPGAGTAGTISVGTVTREIQSAAINTSNPTTDPNALSTQTTFSSAASYDLDAFAKIGTVGFGDADVSEDDKYLWIVNLNQRSLIRIDLTGTIPTDGSTIGGSLVGHFPIVTTSLPSCNGTFRPWGLDFHDGDGYVGVVCDATGSGATTADLDAYVLRFDPNNPTSFTNVLSIALDYNRESSSYDNVTFSGGQSQRNWNIWQNRWVVPSSGVSSEPEWAMPQPILSDIEFTEDGDMVLGFLDRFGLQGGYWQHQALRSDTSANNSVDSGGDILQACNTSTGFVLEGFTGCVIDGDTGAPNPGTNNARRDGLNNDGPNGVGEFYYQDFSLVNSVEVSSNQRLHLETHTGALGIWYGSGLVLSTNFDTISEEFNQGVHWYDTTAGTRSNQYRVTPGASGRPTSKWLRTKATGLGDVELLRRPAPIELGNRVWNDSNKNGRQDPGESGISGVVVGLYDSSGVLIAQVTTDSNGNYRFSSDSGASTTGITYGVNIQPNTQYTLAVFDSNFNSGNPLAGLSVTTANFDGQTDNNAFTDIRDSDAVTLPGSGVGSGSNAATLGVTFLSSVIGGAGYNNHSADFGFYTTPTAAHLGPVSATANDNATVTLHWESLSELNALGFNVLRAAKRNGQFVQQNVELIPALTPGDVNGNAYEFTDTNVKPDKTYFYRIELVAIDNTTEQSEPIKVQVGKDTTCLGKPDKAALLGPENDSKQNPGKITFTWNPVNCAATYQVQIRLASPDGELVVESKSLTKTQFSTQKLEKGKTYFWRVLACNADAKCSGSEWWTFKVAKKAQ